MHPCQAHERTFGAPCSSWLPMSNCGLNGEHEVIAPGVFTLKRKLIRYIQRYNWQLNPAKWKYFDPLGRITSELIV